MTLVQLRSRYACNNLGTKMAGTCIELFESQTGHGQASGAICSSAHAVPSIWRACLSHHQIHVHANDMLCCKHWHQLQSFVWMTLCRNGRASSMRQPFACAMPWTCCTTRNMLHIRQTLASAAKFSALADAVEGIEDYGGKVTTRYMAEEFRGNMDQAEDMLRYVIHMEMFDVLRELKEMEVTVPFPLRSTITLPSEVANEFLEHIQGSGSSGERERLCGIDAAEFLQRTVLTVVREAIQCTNSCARLRGQLRAATPGVPAGDGFVLAGGSVANMLLPDNQRRPVTDADVDIFCCGSALASAMAQNIAGLLQTLGRLMAVADGDDVVITEQSVSGTVL
ncbi:hypothetical protein Vretimale_398 [Volvox reticuliferus]|uniref:Uncharacterized protein n=1 Tax=Volvox reticuliferus TaxID=1737510 RepID=A0A8J4CAH9_9CHLO|nr:hypothetical protein Vretifemale_8112 [Volvox reticuliferus]GIL94065.1 hypothetical protein Vretimale_398 [Volvox reticuliferus]